MLIQLLYLSTASHAMSDAELETILETSVRNNQRLGVTGLLVIKDRTFMQALEGEADTVYRLYETIAADPRHKHIIKISEEEISARQFARWHMGFKNLDKLPPVESARLLNLSQTDLNAAELIAHPGLVHELFRTFVEQG